VGAALLLFLARPGMAEDAAVRSLPDLVLNLARLQDAAARGDPQAGPMQRLMIREISAELLKADPLTLPDPPTLRAAIVYVLSGGRPSDVDVLLRATPESDLLRWLLVGAVHYAKGEKEEALKAFEPYAPEKLPHSIGGRIALATAMLLPDTDMEKRIALLETAARLMPGTLVEEAALRRLTAIAVVRDDPLQFQKTAERYVWRYAESLYAGGFMKDYVTHIVAFEAKAKPVDRLAFEIMMNKLPKSPRSLAYLGVARRATSLGLVDLALFASTRARRLAPQGSDAWQAATLYDAAILVTGADYGIALGLLREVDAARLDDGDRALLAAVTTLAEQLRAPPGPTPDADLALKDEQSARTLPADQQALAAKAASSISAADQMLEGLTQ
jgi:chemotaxis protein MotC